MLQLVGIRKALGLIGLAYGTCMPLPSFSEPSEDSGDSNARILSVTRFSLGWIVSVGIWAKCLASHDRLSHLIVQITRIKRNQDNGLEATSGEKRRYKGKAAPWTLNWQRYEKN
jgi:hypothetical protein